MTDDAQALGDQRIMPNARTLGFPPPAHFN
jgi:hypothetical protein